VCGIVCWGSGTNDLTSVTDDKGNTYTVQQTVLDTAQAESMAAFFLPNITNGPITITGNLSTARGFRGIAFHEVSGVLTSLPLDKNAGQDLIQPGTAANAVTSGSVTTTAAGDYIFAGTTDTAAVHASEFAAGTGYTIREQTGSATAASLATEDQIQAAAAAIAGTFTAAADGATDTYITFIMAFKASAAATGTLPRLILPPYTPY
jgi:hypothetical protein